MENKIKGLYPKLHVIQSQINGLGKDKKAFGYDYVTGSKVLEHIKPLMNELGLLLKQEVLSIENTRQDYVTAKGVSKNEILSKVAMRFTWIDTETGDKDENLFGANGQNDWDKGVGSALTYAERYFLLKYFHISTDEDDIDNPERKKEEEAVKPKEAVKPSVPTKPLMSSDKVNWDRTVEWVIKNISINLPKVKELYVISDADYKKLSEEVNLQKSA